MNSGKTSLLADDVRLSRIKTLVDLQSSARQLFIKPKQKTAGVMAGSHSSRFRGRGMDFSESRVYQPGDDIRAIDWRVTARTGTTHTKIYTEERERPVFFVVDNSHSMQFATKVAFKSVIAQRLAALLAWASFQHGDRVGGQVFSDQQQIEVQAKGGKAGVLRFLHCLSQAINETETHSTNSLGNATKRLRYFLRPGSLLFVISDFLHWDEQSQRQFSYLSHHCDVVFLMLYDPIEAEAPPAGDYLISDGHRFAHWNTRQTKQVNAVTQLFQQRKQQIQKFCQQHAAFFLDVATNDNLVERLHRHLVLPMNLYKSR
ncbi:MAG: DUF58 domain-containing protein [Gammaproteobacteria bacterium]|nr:DUF58 domain-containing protein [Gammaproteobacteria bacterium]MDH5729685.1 DUF58 domain-containing protein [Gammaproteobacteria bacterium]